MADIIDHPKRRTAPEPRPDKSPARYWMKHDVKAFAFETATADAEGAGALILLRGHYFITGSLPKTDAECSKVCRLSVRKFARIRSWLFSFFDDEGRSEELDASIEEAERIIGNRRDAGRKGGIGKALASASHLLKQNPRQLESQLESEIQQEEETTPRTPAPPPSEPCAREAAEIVATVLRGLPIDKWTDRRRGAFASWIERELVAGVDKTDIIAGIVQALESLDGPPTTDEYFRKPIERTRRARQAPLPGGTVQAVSVDAIEHELCRRLGVRIGQVEERLGGDRLTALHRNYLAGETVSDLATSIRDEVLR
jgi:uncharacterized protein YdaU (DUF1376 family)